MRVSLSIENDQRSVDVVIEQKPCDVIEVSSLEDVSTPLRRHGLIEENRRGLALELVHDAGTAAVAGLLGGGE